MKVNFDPKADALRIKFQDGEYEISKEIEEGVVIDMSKDHKIMAIEILDVSERIPKKNLKGITFDIS